MKRSVKIALVAGISLLVATPFWVLGVTGKVKNLGPGVNSEYSDFAPVISADGNFLYFTSDRPGGLGGQDVWVSERVAGAWTKPKNLGPPVNTPSNEGLDCIVNENGRTFLYMTYCKAVQEGLCDIYVAEELPDGSWTEPAPVGPPINSKYSDANASWDYVNNVMYFVSSRKGGIPGEGPKRLPGEASYDIWYCPRNPDGSWGEAVNLGAPVNTSGWEGVAFYHAADESLYFSSNGHGGMGGADVFRSELTRTGDYGEPEPVYIINTPQDDIYFSISAAGDFAYFSSNSREGLGGEDIFVIPVEVLLKPELLAYAPVEAPGKEEPVPPLLRPRPAPASHVETIYFGFDSSYLLLPEREKLDKIAEFMKKHPTVEIELSGHTDSVGPADYNVMLSKRRADAAVEYLVNKGIDAQRITAAYYGLNKPAHPNDPQYGNPLNRRVEISIK